MPGTSVFMEISLIDGCSSFLTSPRHLEGAEMGVLLATAAASRAEQQAAVPRWPAAPVLYSSKCTYKYTESGRSY